MSRPSIWVRRWLRGEFLSRILGVSRSTGLRIRINPGLFLILLAFCAGAVVFGIYTYRHRFVRSDADMVGLLPQTGGSVFFANVAALRRAGMLDLFAGPKTTQEPEYQEFLRQTHLDYTRDVQAIAGLADAKRILFVVRGRFDWGRLRKYALIHGGGCDSRSCNLPTSQRNRWASFLSIQPDVMGLAVASDITAVNALLPQRNRVSRQIPSHPIWVRISRSLLQNPSSLPVAVRIFAISLQFADRVVLALDSGAESGVAFTLQLDAACPSSATADTIKSQMELQTRALRRELAREHQNLSSSDLTGLLMAGTFRVADKHVIGTWPVHSELLKALE